MHQIQVSRAVSQQLPHLHQQFPTKLRHCCLFLSRAAVLSGTLVQTAPHNPPCSLPSANNSTRLASQHARSTTNQPPDGQSHLSCTVSESSGGRESNFYSTLPLSVLLAEFLSATASTTASSPSDSASHGCRGAPQPNEWHKRAGFKSSRLAALYSDLGPPPAW